MPELFITDCNPRRRFAAGRDSAFDTVTADLAGITAFTRGKTDVLAAQAAVQHRGQFATGADRAVHHLVFLGELDLGTAPNLESDFGYDTHTQNGFKQ